MLWRLGRDWLGEGEDEDEKGGKEKRGAKNDHFRWDRF